MAMDEQLDTQRTAMTIHEEHAEEGHHFWPSHVLNQLIILHLLTAVLISLAVMIPFHLHEKADPLVTPDGIKPEWYFLAAYQVIKYMPKAIGVMVCGIFALGIVIWPFLDQLIESRFGMRAYRKIGTIAVILALLFSFIGWASEQTFHVMGRTFDVDLLGIPHAVSAQDSRQIPETAPETPEHNSSEGSAQ